MRSAAGPLQMLPVAVAAAALFSVVALDVNWEASWHVLQPVDNTMHHLVADNLSLATRRFADKAISDTPLALAVVGSMSGIVIATLARPRLGATLAAVVAGGNYLVGGILVGKEGLFTASLKAYFARPRPSTDLHRNFSFPSGHATSAYYVLGCLFFVILPVCKRAVELSPEPQDESQQQVRKAVLSTLGVVSDVPVAAALTLSGGSLVQLGRVLADVHYVSDVLAGACFGTAGMAATVIVMEWAMQAVERRADVGKAE